MSVCLKLSYPTKVDALLALHRREMAARAGDDIHVVRTYRCPRCWRWHLTSKARCA